jgi:amidophosphoribosyltransferase
VSGLFGVVSGKDCVETLFYGTDYHSHLGTQFGGLAVWGDTPRKNIHDISRTQFKSRFHSDIKNMPGNMGIGVISDLDPQPLVMGSRFGPFAIAVCGLITNAETLANELLESGGGTFAEMVGNRYNDAELVAKIIARSDTIVSGIERALDSIEGSCSMLVMTREGIYAVRDKLGHTPLAVGRRDGMWAVASETCSFHNMGFTVERFLEPGEIVLLTEKGPQTQRGRRDRKQVCTFLWIYTGYPASAYDRGISVELVRERCGRFLARRDTVEADMAAGVPDSGTAHAIGYAMEAGIPFRRPLVKYTDGYGRSYTPPSQEIRDKIAQLKLIAVPQVIKGNRIVLCEDSIVRGTQLKNFTVKKLWECGAKEIHVRPACPPLMFPCRYGRSTRTIHELAARQAIREIEGRDAEDVSAYLDHESDEYAKMVDLIGRNLEVTTLKYQRIDDMVEAVGLPREDLCLYCWNGEGGGKGC